MHILGQPINWGTSIYIGDRLYGSLLVWTVYVWAKVNVVLVGCASGKPLGRVSCQVTCKCYFERRLFSCFVMKFAVSVDATFSSTFPCVFFVSIIRSTQMVGWHILMSFLCPLCGQINKFWCQWNFIEIDMNFDKFLQQTVLGFHCYLHFIVALLRVSAWQKYTRVTVCNVTFLITCEWSACFLAGTGRIFKWTYIYWRSRTVSSSCEPLCYTYWRFCSSWQ